MLQTGVGKRHPRQSARLDLELEALEERSLLSISFQGVPDWLAEGPGPILGQSGLLDIPAENYPEAGAVEVTLPDPNDPRTLYAASVNGGVWVTHNYNPSDPNWDPASISWRPLTDWAPSLSMSALAFDPTDSRGLTLYAGTGLVSHGGFGGALDGLLKTTDGGATWRQLGVDTFDQQSIVRIVPTSIVASTGPVVLVGASNGLYRSDDGGSTWNRIMLPAADGSQMNSFEVDSVVADPSDPYLFYAGVKGQGIYRGTFDGQNWTWQRWDGNLDSLNPGIVSGSTNVQIAVHYHHDPATGATSHVLYAVLRAADDDFFWSDDGRTWNTMAPVPAGGLGEYSLLADRTNPNVIYVGGYSNQVWRGDRSQPTQTQWVNLVGDNANNTTPHADSRILSFDSAGNILESCDGGIYRLWNPTDPRSRIWQSLDGNITPTEFYSVAYDALNGTIFGGAQDNGSAEQLGAQSPLWRSFGGSDGGVAQVDVQSMPEFAIHYKSDNSLSAFTRHIVDSSNHVVSDVSVGLVVKGTDGRTLTSSLDLTIRFTQPYVLNTVDPMRMLIGTDYLYESIPDQNGNGGRGDVLTSLGGVGPAASGGLTPLNPVGQVTAMIYGGRRNGMDNADLTFIATSGGTINGRSGMLFRRTAIAVPGSPSLADFTPVPIPQGSTTPQDLITDPDDWRILYLLDSSGHIYETINADAASPTWMPLTGNLPDLTTDLHTLALVKSGDHEALLAGGEGGVYRAIDPSSSTPVVWTRLGNDLLQPWSTDSRYFPPHALVTDLRYYPTVLVRTGHGNAILPADVLVIGTYGRGAWMIVNASSVLTAPGRLQINLDPGEDVHFLQDANDPRFLDIVTANGSTPSFSIESSVLQQIGINAPGGNQIDLDQVPAGITLSINGGTGSDTVNISPSTGNLNSIQGNIAVNNTNGGSMTLTVSDRAFEGIATYVMDDRSLVREWTGQGLVTGTISYSGVNSITLGGGSNPFSFLNTYEINNTELNGTTTINTGSGSDAVSVERTSGPLTVNLVASGNPLVEVSPVAQNLGTIAGALTVNGGGFGTLNLDDQGYHDNQNEPFNFPIIYELNGASLNRVYMAPIHYSGLAGLTLNGGSGVGRTFEIYNTAVRTTTTVNTANGDDVVNVVATTGPLTVSLTGSGNPTINVSPAAHNLNTIQGNLTVDGGGFGTVSLNDQSAPVANAYTLNASSLSRANFGGLTYRGIGSLTINAAPDTNASSPQPIYVLGTPAGTATTINAANGWHNIFVGLPSGNKVGVPGAPLDNIAGPVTVSGQAYQDNLDLYDTASTARKTYTLNASSISASTSSGVTSGQIGWQGFLSTVVLFGSGASDTYLLRSAPTGLADLEAFGAWTANTFQSLLPDRHTWGINSSAGITTTVSPGHYVIFGAVWNFTGGPAGDDFLFMPSNGHDGSLNGVLNGNGGTLDYSQATNPMTVNLASNSATNLDGGGAGGFANIQAVLGDNRTTTLVGPNRASYWTITGPNQGNLAQAPNQPGSFTFSQVPNLTGGVASDVFQVRTGGSLSGGLNGGAGTNTLDYSPYVGNVTVVLPLGVATGLTRGISNIQNVTGSIGNDLLVGDAHANVLIGGTGRNVLIGGAGPDTLDASRATGDNLLIGGRTDFDTSLSALDAILAEWTRTDLGFSDRSSDLTSGRNSMGSPPRNVVNGQLRLLTAATNPTSSNGTVHADSSPDTLIGSTRIDPATGRRVHNWFFVDAVDTVVNLLDSSDRRTLVR
jgi:hypothetical protein